MHVNDTPWRTDQDPVSVSLALPNALSIGPSPRSWRYIMETSKYTGFQRARKAAL